MSSRRSRTDRNVQSDTDEIDSHSTDVLNDVVLLINGKKLKTNSTLLAHNSPRFTEMIHEARTKRTDDDTVILYESTTDRKSGRRENHTGNIDVVHIELPDQSYSDMKLLVQAIENHRFKPDSLTGEKALKILPLTEQFKMKHLKKKCSEALVAVLNNLKNKHAKAQMPMPELLKYMSVADKYRLGEVKEICLDECSKCNAASDRDELVNDEHISEKCKTQILNMMCDGMSDNNEKNLKEIRQEMDKRCEEIEKRRNEFIETVNAWKTELKKEVDEFVEEVKAGHNKLHQELEQKKIIEHMTYTIEQNSNSLQLQLQQLKTEMEEIVDRLEENDKKKVRIPPEVIREKLTQAHNTAMDNLVTIPESFKDTISKTLVHCEIENLQLNVNESFTLQQSHDRASAGLASTLKRLFEAEVKFQQEFLDHEKTKVQLMRYQKREHSINTWIKWAKPPSEKGDMCTCFRHTRERQPFGRTEQNII